MKPQDWDCKMLIDSPVSLSNRHATAWACYLMELHYKGASQLGHPTDRTVIFLPTDHLRVPRDIPSLDTGDIFF